MPPLFSRLLPALAIAGAGFFYAAAPATPPATAPATFPAPTASTAPKVDEPADKPTQRLRNGAVDNGWVATHNRLVTLAKAGNIDLYFTGDSITDYWGRDNRPDTTHPFRESFQKYFGGWKTANFGIAADRTEHVLWRVINGELDVVKPKVIVLLVGTNNLPKDQGVYAPKTAAEDAAGVKAILNVMKQKQPLAKILLVSVFPREDKINAANPDYREDLKPKVKELNALLAKFDDGKQIKFLDIYDKFLGPDGKLIRGVMTDNLHPSMAGYDIWAKEMLPILTEWLGPPATAPATSPAQ